MINKHGIYPDLPRGIGENGLKMSRAKTEFLEFCYNNTVGGNGNDHYKVSEVNLLKK